MHALPMNIVQTRNTYTQENGKPYDKIVVGAIIFGHSPGEEGEILLLKRSAHEKFYPNVFEVPGGHVEDSDETIIDAVKREVSEETGMEVLRIIAAVTPFAYTSEKKIVAAVGEESLVSKTTLQLSYICEVAKLGFAVNPEEHSQGKFVKRADIAGLDVTEKMRTVVEEGFIWIEQNLTRPMAPDS